MHRNVPQKFRLYLISNKLSTTVSLRFCPYGSVVLVNSAHLKFCGVITIFKAFKKDSNLLFKIFNWQSLKKCWHFKFLKTFVAKFKIYNSLAREASREVANLTERKNTHPPIFYVKYSWLYSLSFSLTLPQLSQFWQNRMGWKILWTSFPNILCVNYINR